MPLRGRVAVVFAATGAVGSAVARELRARGAELVVSARSEEPLLALGHELSADAEVVDATDEGAVERHLARVVSERGRLDVVFDAIGPRPDALGYGQPITRLSTDAFLRTFALVCGSQLLVARAAARHMVTARTGCIVTLSASLAAQCVPYMAGISAAYGAVEALTRSLAAELGPYGVRVNAVRAGGMPGTRTLRETFAALARTTGAPAEPPPPQNPLRRAVVPEDVAHVVAMLASDDAGAMTGQVVDVSAGAVVAR